MTDIATPCPPGKRLALFFDGTWNIPENNTNVWRLSLMLADRGNDGVPQRKFYDEGVGTRWFDRPTGGAFGTGLSENVRLGYRWLIEHYNTGDEIFLFGFSRGAFTARSLAGIIARCGLLKPDAPMSFAQVFERYQKGDTVRSIYTLRHLQQLGHVDFDFEEEILLQYSQYGRNFIKMVGVWDTVGSIGVPIGNWKGISRRTLRFHDTNLSTIVQHSYQALALDEQRSPYWAILWTTFIPDQPGDPEATQVDNRMVEQRWFAGSHCNVGGGYRHDLLPQLPLAWIQQKARACGLGFRSMVTTPGDKDPTETFHDSYAEFLLGFWKIVKLDKRYVRWVMSDPVRKKAHANGKEVMGTVKTVNERIDLSVIRRCQSDQTYRPLSLLDWAKRKNLNLEAVIKTPELYSPFWTPVTEPGIEETVALET